VAVWQTKQKETVNLSVANVKCRSAKNELFNNTQKFMKFLGGPSDVNSTLTQQYTIPLGLYCCGMWCSKDVNPSVQCLRICCVQYSGLRPTRDLDLPRGKSREAVKRMYSVK